MDTMETEEHDRGRRYDIAVLSRRRALLAFGAGVAAVATASSTERSTDSSATRTAASPTATSTSLAKAAPEETKGPYPGDGSNGPNVLIESGVVRSDITGSFGPYTEQNYLRGVQVADDTGTVTFTTIFPACYPGRRRTSTSRCSTRCRPRWPDLMRG